jgi:peptide/nickel transport system permease protein
MTPRSRAALIRLLSAIPTLLAMSVFVFALIRLVPGDPVRSMLGFRATPESIRTVRAGLGLDHPLVRQYLDWIGGALHGDLGTDYVSGTPVSTLVGDALPVTLELTLGSMLIGTLAGVIGGVVSASGRGTARAAAETVSTAGISVPDFWLGTLLILLFAGTWQLLPPSGYVPFTSHPGDNVRYMALPVLTLAIGEAAYILRTTRASMQETLERPFVTFLRAKGLRRHAIVYRHALRTASLPIVTVAGIQFGVLLGGAIVIETLFGLPGVGKLVVTAINQRNYTVVQGSVLVIATLFILVNLATDLVYGLLNPRLGGERT